MPKCERWIVAQKMVEVIDAGTMKSILDLGGQIGGGWNQIHQHVFVNPENKEKIEELLRARGFEVLNTGEAHHPEKEAHGQP
jgi:hypothetical protein